MTISERETAHQLILDLYNSGQLKLESKPKVVEIEKILTSIYEFVPHGREFGKWNLTKNKKKKAANV